ncbi:hypothetical protein EB796_020795 [Bugula neritina]|uniref:mRNA m(6)A methyltransferase n=1 Tax=Bugula neritina TaxID=10212 RepID=A0A7J7J3V9_BUGNE|nr:hypothetical protein EB796_020795 [Bugula neritina]
MSDTWDEIQTVRKKTAGLRDKLAKRKQERQNILQANSLLVSSSSTTVSTEIVSSEATPLCDSKQVNETQKRDNIADKKDSLFTVDSQNAEEKDEQKLSNDDITTIEDWLLVELDMPNVSLPLDGVTLSEKILHETKVTHTMLDLASVLANFESRCLLVMEKGKDESIKILSTNHVQIANLAKERGVSKKRVAKNLEITSDENKKAKTDNKLNIEMLLASETAKERETKKLNEEIKDLLSAASAKEQMMSSKFKSQGGTMKEFCSYGTRSECRTVKGSVCDKVHFRKLIHQHTDTALGDCSFLNTCFHMDTCKYIHYEVDQDDLNRIKRANMSAAVRSLGSQGTSDFKMMPPQWVQCDMRNFDMSVLGKFAVIMADPPWDIHMELPYGTMSDDEMRSLNIPTLQDDGYIFLWVTGRAMELGRQCLELWGYRRCDELIWVKTNQLQKLIRTGRTGHWINHGKEHCLIGVKGNPQHMNKGLDCDVIVAEVRATSHKPDEIYGVIERLSPGTRKIELFGRPHNVQPNWMTLGNQLDGVQLHEEDVKRSFKEKYPDGKCI